MLKARDPKSRLMVEPNPGARAECQFCLAVVIAKCGKIVGWHWSHHAGQSCEEWQVAEREEELRAREAADRSKQPPRHLCTSCVEWQRGCKSREPLAAEWLEAWGNVGGGVAWFYRGAPQCPAWRWDKPFARDHDQNPVKSQWRDRP